ncbi:trehalose-phosphatase [Aurantimonas sp. Leaf443]|uniref:trehalose-phosphatase n=1 Tax=Aurantimonas sp. Leaf443 TaxID=1736378 RepID=UPI000AB106F7|nr:trehalose-phosphatase [Aurantimonas sp. Leaf443]
MTEPLPLDPAAHALFLDFDGTLVPFADDPAGVSIAPEAVAHLARLGAAMEGALAIVSGRRIVDLDRFLAPLRFAAAGVHGLERRVSPGEPVESLAGRQVLDEARAVFDAARAAAPRMTFEDKGMALVLHYRAAPDLEPFALDLMARATAGRQDLAVMRGDKIVEVHPAGMDKGQAVADFLARAPFAGRVPVYVGDDTTDEYALDVVERRGGIAVKVGTAPSVARHRLRDVAAVHRWLGVPDPGGAAGAETLTALDARGAL